MPCRTRHPCSRPFWSWAASSALTGVTCRGCLQVLIWEDRDDTGKGGWEVRPLSDPRRPSCEILCACYTRTTGKLPLGAS